VVAVDGTRICIDETAQWVVAPATGCCENQGHGFRLWVDQKDVAPAQ
jgi:hypothetical protein